MRALISSLLVLLLAPAGQALADNAQPPSSAVNRDASFVEFKAQTSPAIAERASAAASDKRRFELVIATRTSKFPDIARGSSGRLPECAIPHGAAR